ncbi:Small GTP-binding protein domain [Trinorchestia longiramus]|nr:Small GTP-binding protein domain [Trinorchestia longiramus]
MAVDFTDTYKILVIGDVNVGKTCLVHRFCDERYYDTYISTVGIDFKQKIVNLDGVPVRLQIWDTAGEERFRTLTTAYYRGAQGIVLMYDITNTDSFDHLSYWLRNIEENASPEVAKILAANKCEVFPHHRLVEKERGERLADCYGMQFYEVSCRSDINVQETFRSLARAVRDQRLASSTSAEDQEKNVNLEESTSGISKCGSC